ncbi:DUF6406 domain-containing protein [Thermoactinospora rubra]|uniref:DUF6406 domain-containing protein n=1 Tax=Thermoactinospora rubra TaxID=1088767 RepID=UPI000A11C595|nr:DUF6406 domain-containing protein [Thermoactinospora rubra]
MRGLLAALAAALVALACGTACAAKPPSAASSSVPPGAEQITLTQGVPHWLDNATRKRHLAIMSFEEDPLKVVIGLRDNGRTTTHTLGIDDTIDVDGRTWRVTRIDAGPDGLAVLTAS